MNYKRIPILAVAAALGVAVFTGAFLLAVSAAPGASGYKVIKTVPISGEGGWDYVTVDSDARRVYVSHATQVVVLDADSYEVVGSIPDTQGVHGIAIASDLGRGFTSNGRTNTATIFDLKTLKTIGTVNTGANPDAIVYDSGTKRVFTLNGRSKDATAINAADGTVAGTLALGGKPEFAVADGKGSIYVNIEDTSELVQFDPQKLTVTHRWPQKPCQEASGLAIDRKNRRLFSGCDNKMMAVMDADSGKVVATPRLAKLWTPTVSIRPRSSPSLPTVMAPLPLSTRTPRTNLQLSKMSPPKRAPAPWPSTLRPTTSFSQPPISIRLLPANAAAR